MFALSSLFENLSSLFENVLTKLLLGAKMTKNAMTGKKYEGTVLFRELTAGESQ